MEDNNNLNIETNQEFNQNEKKNIDTKKGIIIGFIIVLFLCLTVFGATILLSNKGTDETQGSSNPTFDLTEDGNASEGGVEGKSKEEIEAELNAKVAEGMINISMNTNPVFEDGSSEGNLLIVNEEINNHPQVIEIYRDDTNELIYKSGAVSVGSKIEKGRLSVDLDKGDYACTAYFNAVNKETGELVGKAGAKITITVNN